MNKKLTIIINKRTNPQKTIKEKAETVVNVHCFGKSISLNLKSKEEDEKIINSLIQH